MRLYCVCGPGNELTVLLFTTSPMVVCINLVSMFGTHFNAAEQRDGHPIHTPDSKACSICPPACCPYCD